MQSESDLTEKYSVLTETEERLFALDAFFFAPIAFLISTQIAFILYKHLKTSKSNKENIYYIYAIQCALISAICTIFVGILKTFFCNNLIIPWSITESSFAAIFDSVANIFYFSGKILFYFSFSFHIQSILYSYNHSKISTFLKIWMIFVAVFVTILTVIYLADDIIVTSTKEIGLTAVHGIYISMYLGHQSTTMVPNVCMFGFMMVDFVFFAVLIYFYASNITKIQSNDTEIRRDNVKGLVLIVYSSFFFLIAIFAVGLNSASKWALCGVAIISDDVFLFLMFKCSSDIYDFFGGCFCHRCVAKIIYASKYKQIEFDMNDEIDEQL